MGNWAATKTNEKRKSTAAAPKKVVAKKIVRKVYFCGNFGDHLALKKKLLNQCTKLSKTVVIQEESEITKADVFIFYFDKTNFKDLVYFWKTNVKDGNHFLKKASHAIFVPDKTKEESIRKAFNRRGCDCQENLKDCLYEEDNSDDITSLIQKIQELSE